MNMRTHTEQGIVQELKPPAMYKVVLINDSTTPTDFVVELLMRVFTMARSKAEKIMLQVHHRGRGVCGVFSREIAETKAAEVMERAHGYSLKCIIEKLDREDGP